MGYMTINKQLIFIFYNEGVFFIMKNITHLLKQKSLLLDVGKLHSILPRRTDPENKQLVEHRVFILKVVFNHI